MIRTSMFGRLLNLAKDSSIAVKSLSITLSL
jgi:hypothetical protein